MAKFGLFIMSLFSIFAMACWGGYVFCHLWEWFIVSAFLGAPVLTVAQAIGITLTARIGTSFGITKTQTDEETKDMDGSEKLLYSTVKTFSMYGFFLLYGWIVTLFL